MSQDHYFQTLLAGKKFNTIEEALDYVSKNENVKGLLYRCNYIDAPPVWIPREELKKASPEDTELVEIKDYRKNDNGSVCESVAYVIRRNFMSHKLSIFSGLMDDEKVEDISEKTGIHPQKLFYYMNNDEYMMTAGDDEKIWDYFRYFFESGCRFYQAS